MTKTTKKYHDLLEYSSIEKYLDLAIGKKKSKISGDLSLKEKIKKINITAYLRGIAVFFEYSANFNNPSEIIDYWKRNRDNDQKIEVLSKEVSNFPNWLLKERKLSESTAITYQTHIRGFLTNNNIRLTFKNYDPKTEKKKTQNKLGITYEEMLKFSHKIKDFIRDLDLQLLCEFMHRTGLAFREIADLTFGDLRAKNYEQEYILFAGDREKSSVEFANYISPDLKEYILAYLRENQDEKDETKIFGNDTNYAYHKFDLNFNTAYIKCCRAYFPRFSKVKTPKGNLKKLFSLHSFRSVFKQTCDNLRIIPEHRDLLIAHKSEKMTNYDLISEELLNDYKIIENAIFGTKTTDNQTIEDVFDILKEIVSNKGKRQAIFRKYQEDQTIDMTAEIKGVVLLEQFKHQIMQEIKQDLVSEIKQEILNSISLKDLLLTH